MPISTRMHNYFSFFFVLLVADKILLEMQLNRKQF